MTTRDIVFAVIGVIASASAIFAVTTRNLVHAALWLVVCLGTIAGCYVVLGAELVYQVAGHLGRALAAEAGVERGDRRLQRLAERVAAVAQVVVGAAVDQVVLQPVRVAGEEHPGRVGVLGDRVEVRLHRVVGNQHVGQRAVHPAADHRVHLAVRARGGPFHDPLLTCAQAVMLGQA